VVGDGVWTYMVLKTLRGNVPQIHAAQSSGISRDETLFTLGLCSPVHHPRDGAGYPLLAYRSDNGSPSWQAGTNRTSYASPTLVRLCRRRQILSVNLGTVTAHDPTDGHVLWQYDWPDHGLKCAQPVCAEGDRVFLSSGFGVGCSLIQVKTNAQGAFEVSELWRNFNMKTEFCSAIVHDSFAYGLDDGTLVCLDLVSGKRRWKDGRYGHGQIILVGDLLLVQTEAGQVALVEANPSQYVEAAKLGALSSKTWNYPALAGDFLLVRNDREAVCYRMPTRGLASQVKGPSGAMFLP